MFKCWTWILFLGFALVNAVDRGKFKTCDQSQFCKRQRNVNSSQITYQLLKESISNFNNKLYFDIKNNNKGTLLKASFSIHVGSIIRFEINDTLTRRFTTQDALLPNLPNLEQISYIIQENSMVIRYKFYSVLINFNPFHVVIDLDGAKMLSFNSDNLFNFEQTPDEKDEEDDPVTNVVDKNDEEIKKEVKSKEETFDGHTDSRPHGDTSIGVDLKFHESKHLYGIPEHADNFMLRSTLDGDPYRLYNFDVFEYEIYNRMALYGSIPYMIAHSPKHTVGIFWNNPSEMWIDVDLSPERDAVTHWMAESGVIDMFFLLGPTPSSVFQQYAYITGVTQLPPISTLGYHQCRWNYNSETDVINVLNKFDEHDIPVDFIWLDIEHTDGKRYFTWDKQSFPHPLEMVNYLVSKGRKLVTIVDPHIKAVDDYRIYHEANVQDKFYVQTKDNKDFEGWCWPGTSKYPDFARPEVRDWWASKFAFSDYNGTTQDVYVWNDMNEPSVFNGPEVTMPKDATHFKGTVEHRDLHNIYGLYVHAATNQGLMDRSNSNIRPYVLARAFFAGSQRTTSVWTGDNTAEWSHLKISGPMILSLSITGMTFSGADVGGFFKNPDQDLLLRWYQAGAYQPFFRAHAHIDTARREPWLFPHILPQIKAAIYERYTFIPFWYTLFYESETTGMPVMRPLWVNFPSETTVFGIDNEHMIGDALLIHPVTDPNTREVNVYFPGHGEVWYDMYTGKQITQSPKEENLVVNDGIVVYQRGGTIIPRKMRQRRSATISHKDDPYTLYIALDLQNNAHGTLYIDDGLSFDYKNGKYIYAQFEFKQNSLTCKLIHNNFPSKSFYERFVIRGISRPKAIVDASQKHQLITFTYEETNKELVVKKPVGDVTSNWTLFFKF